MNINLFRPLTKPQSVSSDMKTPALMPRNADVAKTNTSPPPAFNKAIQTVGDKVRGWLTRQHSSAEAHFVRNNRWTGQLQALETATRDFGSTTERHYFWLQGLNGLNPTDRPKMLSVIATEAKDLSIVTRLLTEIAKLPAGSERDRVTKLVKTRIASPEFSDPKNPLIRQLRIGLNDLNNTI